MSAPIFQLVVDWTQSNSIKRWRLENKGASVSWAEGSGVGQCSIADICFADDETIIADDAMQLQDMMDTVVCDLKRVGLKVSAAKTSWMGVNIGESSKVMMGDVEIPRHGQLTLLGSIIRCDGNMTHEVASRISKALTYYHTFRYIFENKYVSVKMRIVCRSEFLDHHYASQTWVITPSNTTKQNEDSGMGKDSDDGIALGSGDC